MVLTATAVTQLPAADKVDDSGVTAVTVLLPASLHQALALVVEESGQTAAEVVDRALQVYQLVEALLEENDGHLRLWHRDGLVETIPIDHVPLLAHPLLTETEGTVVIAPTTLHNAAGCDRSPRNLTVDLAHAIMQQHLHVTPNCKQRQAALALLVETGRYRLAS